jgi:hypothetical protein
LVEDDMAQRTDWPGEWYQRGQAVAQADLRYGGGNPDLLASLTSADSVLTLHVGADGDDDAGNGLSASSKFRQIQRALDEVPRGGRGRVHIQLHGAGPFKGFRCPDDYQSSDVLKVVVIGDTSSPALSFAMPAGSTVANPDGGDKGGVVDLNVGAYTVAITNGSHWIQVTDADLSHGYFGMVVDGENCASPNLRAIWYASIATTFMTSGALQPFVSVIDDVGTDPGRGTILKGSQVTSTQVVVVGCILGPTSAPYLTDCDAQGCLCPFGLDAGGRQNFINVHTQLGAVLHHAETNQYYGASTYLGLWECGNGENMNIFSPAFYLSGVVRGRDGNGDSCFIGSHTTPGNGAAGKLEDLDCEDTITAFVTYSASLRIGNNGTGVSLEDVTTFVRLRYNSILICSNPNVYGFTDGVCVKLENGSQAFVAGFGSAPRMRNTTTPGADVQVGDLASPSSWASLPKNDLTRGDTCQFCRAFVTVP